jgi:hypothetical protein
MSEDRCKKHDMLPGQCADCLGHTSIEDQALADRSQLLHQPGWFPAKFGGTCRRCGEPFTPDTAIRRQADSQGYIAECCGLAEPTDTTPASPDAGPGTHTCPGGCRRQVPRHLYACKACWVRLPFPLRQPISANYQRDDAQHAAAMAAAQQWYHQTAGVRT